MVNKNIKNKFSYLLGLPIPLFYVYLHSIFFIIFVLILYYFIVPILYLDRSREYNYNRMCNQIETVPTPNKVTQTKYRHTYNNNKDDILLNPYSPPISKNHYNIHEEYDINNPSKINEGGCTQCTTFGNNFNNGYVTDEYSQMGFIVNESNSSQILPLMGRLLYKNRDKWQYYVINNDNNAVKLSIISGGKKCTSEYGCNEIVNNDIVKVDGTNDLYKVTIYDINDSIYSPSLD
jgi:hypothetical protein